MLLFAAKRLYSAFLTQETLTQETLALARAGFLRLPSRSRPRKLLTGSEDAAEKRDNVDKIAT